MNSVKRYFALFAVLPFATTSAAGPFDGIYRPNYDSTAHWNCTDIGADSGAMAIQGNVLFETESNCILTDPVRVNGMNAVLYNGQCAIEGTEYSERVMLMKSGHGVYVIRDGFVLDLIHCN